MVRDSSSLLSKSVQPWFQAQETWTQQEVKRMMHCLKEHGLRLVPA